MSCRLGCWVVCLPGNEVLFEGERNENRIDRDDHGGRFFVLCCGACWDSFHGVLKSREGKGSMDGLFYFSQLALVGYNTEVSKF